MLNPTELEDVGFKIATYPLSLMGVSIRAMQVRYLHLVFPSFIFFSLLCPKCLVNVIDAAQTLLQNLIFITTNLSFKCELKHDPSCLNT